MSGIAIDQQIGRIEQPRPGVAVRRAGIDRAGEGQRLTLGLDKAAIAALHTAARQDGAVERGRHVGPHTDSAAVAIHGRRGVDDGRRIDRHIAGIGIDVRCA